MRERKPDDDLLETLVGRRDALAALSGGSRSRRELEAELDVSKSTCHRIVRALEERGLAERVDHEWTLTGLGDVVATRTASFQRAVTAAYRLEPLVDAFASAAVDFDVELFADATLTRPQPDTLSPPINRYLELYREADAVRTIDRTSFVPPLYFEKLYELAEEGDKTAVAVLPESVVETRLTEFPDIHRAAAATREPAYRIHDGVPFGMTLYDDDHVALRAYDDESGALLLFADTDDPDAVAWARDVYDHYYEESKPLSAVDGVPDWSPDAI
ncbi:helix-turn-helix transcriptional regulator [Halobacterium yunchengense]|uniref:helix-turn-helix transcriptional regulator n=1 Tax=Halobacterium yunchengense TaxID=3108497 RepID=UPI003008C71A